MSGASLTGITAIVADTVHLLDSSGQTLTEVRDMFADTTALALKANTADVYSKTIIVNQLALKSDVATTYSKSAVDTLIANIPAGTNGTDGVDGTNGTNGTNGTVF